METFKRTESKKIQREEVLSGLESYLSNRSGSEEKIGRQASFYNENVGIPINRKTLEHLVDSFMDKHYKDIVESVVDGHDGYFIDHYDIKNKELRNFGFDETNIFYYQNDYLLNDRHYKNGKYIYNDVIKTVQDGRTTDDRIDLDQFTYDSIEARDIKVSFSKGSTDHENNIYLSELISTGFLLDTLEIDTKFGIGGHDSSYPQRYYLKAEDRYLCKNDYGMANSEGESDVTNIIPFAKTVQRDIRRIISNVSNIKNILSQSSEEILDNDQIKKTLESEKIKNIILDAIPYQKFIREVSGKNEEAVRNIMLDKMNDKDIFEKLEYVQSEEFKKEVLSVVFDDIQDFSHLKDGCIIAHSIEHDRPVILENKEYLDTISHQLSLHMVTVTENDILESYPDDRMKKIVKNSRDGWSNSGATEYRPDNIAFYRALDRLGIDKFLEIYPDVATKVLENEGSFQDRNLSDFIYGVSGIYSVFGDQIKRMEPQKIKKEIWHDQTLKNVGMWDYFTQREIGIIPPYHDNTTENYGEYNQLRNDFNLKKENYLSNLSSFERRKLFFEGKQMYWLAKQVQSKIFELEKNKNIQTQGENNQDQSTEEFKFHHYHNNINWEQYDCKNVDLEKLTQYLGTHGNIICTLLVNKNGNGEVGSNVNLETIMQVVEAMEAGADMRGVALAFDKKKYLDGILSGQEQKNDLEYALKDWPSKLRDVVSLEEFELYFENAEQYLYQDPNGMVRYAGLLQKEPRIRELLGEKIEKKSDLDFRLCLTVQSPDVRNWYFEGAEYIGHNALQKYFVRFNATREQSGGYPNLHDALYWIPNIKRVDSGEARALLDDVNTVDESNELRNFLARYDKERDGLIGDGKMKSLRELKKRVFAIEANIDLSTLPPEIVDIISAPGFDLAQLKRLQGEQRFTDLVEGKLDQEQPFLPHKRMFTARPLTEILKDGLGSFREKIKGTAQDPKGLFSDIRKLMQGREINGKPMQIQDLLREIPLDMEEDILKLLQEQRVATGVLLEATVHQKSDPEGWVCGNYTDCCMPFGDYKNTDYMFNKGTQYFTVKYNDRIIAQSVIVDSIDKTNNNPVIILDNIEIANNYKHQAPILSKIYKTFWAEYTSLPVKIGTGHSDLTPDGAVLVSNTYSPKHSLSYSDATGSNIYDLPKIKGVESLDKIITYSNLSERDAETIVEMEKLAYPKGMAQGKGEILDVIRKTKELDLPGAASSFIIRQGDEPAGYLLLLPESSKLNPNESVAHIYDMAVIPKFQGTGVARKMMERILDVAKSYDLPAIEFEAREGTSYRMITNPEVAKWIESKGYKLSYNEPLPEYLGGENFYYVRFEKINIPD